LRFQEISADKKALGKALCQLSQLGKAQEASAKERTVLEEEILRLGNAQKASAEEKKVRQEEITQIGKAQETSAKEKKACEEDILRLVDIAEAFQEEKKALQEEILQLIRVRVLGLRPDNPAPGPHSVEWKSTNNSLLVHL
jgi:hypothetical protein